MQKCNNFQPESLATASAAKTAVTSCRVSTTRIPIFSAATRIGEMWPPTKVNKNWVPCSFNTLATISPPCLFDDLSTCKARGLCGLPDAIFNSLLNSYLAYNVIIEIFCTFCIIALCRVGYYYPAGSFIFLYINLYRASLFHTKHCITSNSYEHHISLYDVWTIK